MSIQTDNLPGLLEPFGLSQEEARIYLYLVEKRITTALSVIRLKSGRSANIPLFSRKKNHYRFICQPSFTSWSHKSVSFIGQINREAISCATGR